MLIKIKSLPLLLLLPGLASAGVISVGDTDIASSTSDSVIINMHVPPSALYIGGGVSGTPHNPSGEVTFNNGVNALFLGATAGDILFLGRGYDSVGVMNIEGPGTYVNWNNFTDTPATSIIGGYGLGILNIRDGAVTNDFFLEIAREGSSAGIVTISGPGTAFTTEKMRRYSYDLGDYEYSTDYGLLVGEGGNATLNIDNGARVTTAGAIRVGNPASLTATGTLNIETAATLTSLSVDVFANGVVNIGSEANRDRKSVV